MAVNLMEMLKDQVLGQVTGGLSNHLGESEQATKGGLEALLPTVMGGLVKQVSQPVASSPSIKHSTKMTTMAGC